MCLQADNISTAYVKMYSAEHLLFEASHCSMKTLMSALLPTQVCSQGQNRLSVLFCGHVEEEAHSFPNHNRLLQLRFPHLRLQPSYEKLQLLRQNY